MNACPKHQAGGTRTTSAAVCICESAAEIGEADLTRWLSEWVRVHGGTDLRDTAGRLVLVCRCGKALGPSYGPTETGGRDAEERETLAYFQHQAADLLAAFAIGTPPGSATP